MNNRLTMLRVGVAVSCCIGALGALSPVVHAATLFDACPRQIGEGEVHLSGGPTGWTAYSPSRLPLDAVGFMAGAPATKTELKPYSTALRGGKEFSVWKFDPGFLTEPDGLWLVCSYGDGGELTLSKKISVQIVECTVAYEKKRVGVDRDIHVACK